MTYRFVQLNMVANRNFFTFSGPAPFSATRLVVRTSLATSLLTAVASFGIPEDCACGCGGRGVGSVVGNGGVGSCLLASRSLWLRAMIPETSSISSSSSSSQLAIRHRRLLVGSFASFRSITPSGLSSEEVPCEVWPFSSLGQQLVSCLQVGWLAMIHLQLQANQLWKDHRPRATVVHHGPMAWL
jgi:hypothetical protein